jgi:putative membrane protein
MSTPSTSADARLGRVSDRAFYVFNAVLSIGALGFLAYLMVLRQAAPGGARLAFLPAVNAGLNALAASCLVAGYVAIRRKNRRLHRALMASAFSASTLFFVSYLVYHYAHGDTKYTGSGPIRAMYLAILASHILLSMAVVPLAITSLFFALKRSFARHKKIARIAVPIWLYVSVTGVVIFFMLQGSR